MSSPSPQTDDLLGGIKKSLSIPQPKHKPWYANGQWWKQFSVWFSILLSAASLVLGSVGEFQDLRSRTQKVLNVSGLVVNTVSVILSALTSLDWKSAAQIEADLLKHLDTLLVQQPVLAETPGGSAAGEKPSNRTVQVLKLNRPDEEGGGGIPLVAFSSSNKKKGRRRRTFGRGVGGTGTVTGRTGNESGVLSENGAMGNGMRGDEDKKSTEGVI